MVFLKRWFIIYIKDTIIEILWKDVEDKNRKPSWELNQPAFFVPLKHRPDSTCWIKKLKCAWKNGEIKE